MPEEGEHPRKDLRKKRNLGFTEKHRRVRRRLAERELYEKVKIAIELATALISLGLVLWAARHGG